MNVLKFVIVFGSALLLGINAYAQTGEDVSQYFDDGKVAGAKNIVSVSPLNTVIEGDAAIYYERGVTKRLGFVAGIGITFPGYIFEVSSLRREIRHEYNSTRFFESGSFEQEGTGYSWSFQPRYYYSRTYSPEGGFFGLLYKGRVFTLVNDGTIKTHDFGVNYGTNLIVGTRIVVGYDVGIAYRTITFEGKDLETNEVVELKSTAPMLPMRLNIGVLF